MRAEDMCVQGACLFRGHVCLGGMFVQGTCVYRDPTCARINVSARDMCLIVTCVC